MSRSSRASALLTLSTHAIISSSISSWAYSFRSWGRHARRDRTPTPSPQVERSTTASRRGGGGRHGKSREQTQHVATAVSKAIASMEQSLGIRLLDRTSRGVQATMYGETLLRGGIAVFDELAKSLNQIRFLSIPEEGIVRIGCTEPGAAGFVPTVIVKFAQDRPRVLFEVMTADPTTLVEERLIRRQVDLVIGALPAIRSKTEVEVVRLFPDRMVIIASRHSKWAKRRKIKLADLVDEPWVLPRAGSTCCRRLSQSRRGATKPRRQRLLHSAHVAFACPGGSPCRSARPIGMVQTASPAEGAPRSLSGCAPRGGDRHVTEPNSRPANEAVYRLRSGAGRRGLSVPLGPFWVNSTYSR